MAQGLHAEWAQCPTAPGGGGTHDTSRRSGWMDGMFIVKSGGWNRY